jgi:hypothetical protein
LVSLKTSIGFFKSLCIYGILKRKTVLSLS